MREQSAVSERHAYHQANQTNGDEGSQGEARPDIHRVADPLLNNPP